MTACNLRVLGIARYHRHRIASAIYQVTLSAQVTITHQRNPFSLMPATWVPAPTGGPPRLRSPATCTVRLLRIAVLRDTVLIRFFFQIVQLLGSLYAIYLPYCVLIAWKICIAYQSAPEPPVEFEALAATLLACSAPMNGVLYGLKSRTLRHSVRNYFRKKATESELQQEIQARVPSVAGSRRPSGTIGSAGFPMLESHRCLSEVLLPSAERRSAGLRPTASCNTLGVPMSPRSFKLDKIDGDDHGQRVSIGRTGSGAPLLRDNEPDIITSGVAVDT